MPTDLKFSCTCGAVHGVVKNVDAGAGNHAVCYCDDCQAFAHHLGRSADILDANGGTEVFQMSPAMLKITSGLDRLECVRLTPKGLLRWYAGCCNTPIGNTMATSKVPFVGLVHSCIERPSGTDSLDALLGPIQARGFRRFAKGNIALIPADRISLPRLVIRTLGMMVRWKVRGDAKQSPFFAAKTGLAVAIPRVLTPVELSSLIQTSGEGTTRQP